VDDYCAKSRHLLMKAFNLCNGEQSSLAPIWNRKRDYPYLSTTYRIAPELA
jgi:hypothetical protein